MPLALVVAVAVADPLKAAPAPVAGAVKVTVTPLIGLLLASFTVACSAVVNALFTMALCGVPAEAEIVAVPACCCDDRAAPFNVTLPAPAAITQLMVMVWPAEAAL